MSRKRKASGGKKTAALAKARKTRRKRSDQPTASRSAQSKQAHRLRLAKASSGQRTWIGQVSAHPDGFGFVDVPELEKGIFLPPEEMRDLMHGDTVEVRMVGRRGRPSGVVVRVIEHGSSTLVGEFRMQGGIGMVIPRSRKMPQTILVALRDSKGAADGDWVRVEIERGSRPLRGRVVEVFGQNLSPSRLIDIVVTELDLPRAFPPEVEAEANSYPDEIREEDCQGRKDLTHLPFVTIDGADARDFDDAICVLPRGEGFEAWVAIADVAHYVRPGSALDQEALKRSNSFYFPDRVIPMLPEKLSNGLCSLNPRLPRLAMAVRMRFDANGKRRALQVYEAVIRSRARLTYEQASDWLDNRNKHAIEDARVRKMLDDAARLFRRLQIRRQQRGALDLDVPEVRAVLHEGRVTDISSSERNTAHHLIEEMMLATNTAIAEYFEAKQTALLYRVHPAPDREAIESLNEFLAPFGLSIRLPKDKKQKHVRPADILRVLELSADKPFCHVLHKLVLRAMQQAHYTPKNEGHFGLAYKSYTHFTSPIRRYADLTVHRRLKALLHREDPDKAQPAATLAAIGEQTSIQERKQQRGEWDTQAMLAALYHQKDVGKVLPARIAGLTQRRIFFELETTLADASMDVDRLGGMFDLDEKHHRLVARHGGMAYALGDMLKVRIEKVDPVRGQIDVMLALEERQTA